MRAQRCLFLGLAIVLSACSKPTSTAADKAYTYISGPNFSEKKVSYQVKKGSSGNVPVYQGDIKLARSVFAAEATRALVESGRNATSLANSYRDYFWPGDTIPYSIESTDTAFVAAVHDAIADLENRSKIDFIQRSNETDYLAFVRVVSDEICGLSYVGQLGGKQEIEIASDCADRETIQHETIHSLGFWHEQSRPDRDDYIRVLWANVNPLYMDQFDVMPVEADGVGAYDFASVMHYRRDAFSLNGSDTIQADTEAHNALIGNSTEASAGDIQALQSIYGTGTQVDLEELDNGKFEATVSYVTAAIEPTKIRIGATREILNELSVESTGESHSLLLQGLAPKTRYFYQVLIKTNGGNVWSPIRSFITDLTPPAIIDPRVYQVSNGIVEVRFSTNEKTKGSVGYYTEDPDSEVQWVHDFTFGKVHNIRFAAEQGTTLFSVVATDEAGNVSIGSEMSVFNDSVPPTISNVQIAALSSTAATITWTTDEASTSKVKFGTSASALDQTASAPGNGLAHSVQLALAANTTYYFKVESQDAGGNTAVSTARSFSTDLNAPVISNVATSQLGTNSVTIAWTTNEVADSKVTYGTACSALTSNSADATLTTSHMRSLTGLSQNTTYCYRVVSKDAAGNEALSATAQFTTKPLEVLTLSNVASAPTSTSVTVSWDSSLASDSVVEYGTSSGSYPYSASSPLLVTGHSVALTQNLTSGTTYYFRVRSTTALGTAAVSGESSFVFVQHDSVTVSVRFDSGYWWLPRYVTATSTFPQGGTTQLTMKVVTREGIVVASRPMTYQWFPNTYTSEIPDYLSWDVANGWLRVRIESTLGGIAVY